MSGDQIQLQRVGYWWSEKKSRKLNMQLFIKIFRNSGLEVVKLDLNKPLEEQGPFAAIVHKLSDCLMNADNGDKQAQNICKAFQDYIKRHPHVVFVDSFENMRKLLDRSRQYKLVENCEFHKEGIAFIPANIELTTEDVDVNLEKMKAAGVTFPCVCKPSVAHGSTAHQMCLIFNADGLKDIRPPCVVQKFINHNAILYKVLVIDDKYFVVERPSLKNFYEGDRETIFFHSHDISKPYSASELNELDKSEPKTPTVRPEKEKLDKIVQVMRNCLGLMLFGVDIIIDNGTGQYAIIDMNVFPGYDEVTNFFQVLCDFLVKRIKSKLNGPSSPNDVRSVCKQASSGEDSSDIPCFCCPITGVCNSNFHHGCFNYELSQALQHLNKVPKGGDSFCSPEDSGIETSDSCDEKKKATVWKTAKRQHSRSHNSLEIV